MIQNKKNIYKNNIFFFQNWILKIQIIKYKFFIIIIKRIFNKRIITFK